MGWVSLLLLFSAPEKRREWGVGVSPTTELGELSKKVTLLLSLSEVIFDPKVSHFATVPTILYPPKVSSEHLVDDCRTGLNHHRSDPKPIILIKNDDFLSKRHLFFIKNRLFFDAFWAKFHFAATLFVAATARQTPWIKAFREVCGSVAAFFQTFNYYAISAGCILIHVLHEYPHKNEHIGLQ